MSYRPLPEVVESVDELSSLLRQERDATRKARLHLLLLIQTDRVTSQAGAAEHLALHRNTISDWLRRYREGGIEALLAVAPRGKEPGQRTLPAYAFEALEERLATRHGFAGYDDIQRWLFQEFGLEVPYKSVYTPSCVTA